MTRVLTWNLAGRVGEARERQAAGVLAAEADVVCLQEVTPTTSAGWQADLGAAGYEVAVAEWPVKPVGSRRLAVLIAARAGIAASGSLPTIPWPERHLAVVTRDGLQVHTLHAPLSTKPGRVKVATLEALYAAVCRDDDAPRVVTGDFNTPQYESREGEVQTFARTRSGRIREAYGEDHDRAELRLISDLPARGWRDAFRHLHGYERRDRSWKGFGPGYRLDHIVVSPNLDVLACDYFHAWREAGLSDHSGMWADLRRPEVRPAGEYGPGAVGDFT